MPKIYYVFQDGEDGGHHLSLSEAMKDAREWANIHGREWEVQMYKVEKLDLKTFVNALNQKGWAYASEVVAVVNPRKGRKVANG